MAIGRRHLILLPGVSAILANAVPFATYPEPFLGKVGGVFILAASLSSVALGLFARRKGNRLWWAAVSLGAVALILGALLPALFTVREHAHRLAGAPCLGLTTTNLPHDHSG